jgi:SHS2 domain-containing protein
VDQGQFEIIDHTADKGLRARGRSLAQVFENAAYGMFSLIFDASLSRRHAKRRVEVSGYDKEELFVNWLRELLFLSDAQRLAFCGFRVIEIGQDPQTGAWRLAADCEYAREPDKIVWKASPVKAVTYHGLSLEESEEGWTASVIFDV